MDDIITIAKWCEYKKQRDKKRHKKHSKRNQAIEICKIIGLHWKANDNTIKIIEWNETFTHSQTDALLRKLNSLDAYKKINR